MIRLDVTLNGETQMSRSLMVSAGALADFKAPLEESASLLQKTFQQNFDERGGEFGGWSPRTKDYSWPLLEKSGDMRNSFRTDPVSLNTVVLSNSAPYFKYHQLGTRKMPQRLMMKLDNTRKALIVKIFQAHIVESTKDFR